MFEDSYLDSFMESHIGGWTADTESMYDDQEVRDACCDPDGDWDQEDADDFQYDDGYYDEADERLENADLDFDQSDY